MNRLDDIARALKAKAIQWCRENGVRYLYTENDETNSRMLDINIRLGYQPIPGETEMVKAAPFG